jgi:serine/threonine-protein kinase
MHDDPNSGITPEPQPARQPPSPPGSPPTSTATAAPPEEPPGPGPPRYGLSGELGRGGVVVRISARGARTERLVALRFLLTRPTSEDLPRLFEDARILAGLDWPVVVPLFEVGLQAGLPWFTLTLAEGTLSRTLRDRAPVPGDAAIPELLAQAVQEIHRQDTGERKLVPTRVVLESGMRTFVPALGWTESEDRDRDPMGMIVAACLTGGRPFSRVAPPEVLAEGSPAAPEETAPAAPCPDTDLELVVLKCASQEPWRGYASAGELAVELGRWLRGEAVEVDLVCPLRWS